MVYTIVVHLYARDDKEAIGKLKAKLVEASAVYSRDRETLGWFVSKFAHICWLSMGAVGGRGTGYATRCGMDACEEWENMKAERGMLIKNEHGA